MKRCVFQCLGRNDFKIYVMQHELLLSNFIFNRVQQIINRITSRSCVSIQLTTTSESFVVNASI